MEQALSLPYGDAALRAAGLARDPHRVHAHRRRPAGRPEPLHRAQASPTTTGAAISSRPTSARRRSRSTSRTRAAGGAARLIVRELDVDVFCCNTCAVKRYKQLGIDYETLAAVKPDLIWAGISAMGPPTPTHRATTRCCRRWPATWRSPATRDGPPTAHRRPADRPQGRRRGLRQRDAGAARARRERQMRSRIDVSMLQAAASWLITTLPLSTSTATRRRSRAPATSTASSSRPTSIRRATASSTSRSAATCSGAAHRDPEVRAGRQRPCARRTKAASSEREAIHRDMAAVTRRVAHRPTRCPPTLSGATIPMGGDQRHPAGARAGSASPAR
jgi:hypothetical protein